MYDAMVYKKVPHGLEVLFINVIDGEEVLYEDFFDHHDVDLIAMEYIKKELRSKVNWLFSEAAVN